MARSTMLTLPLLALFALPAGAGEMMSDSTMIDPTAVTAERACAAWGAMDMTMESMDSTMDIEGGEAEAMAMTSPDGEMSEDDMARLADIAPAAGPLDAEAAKAAVQRLGEEALGLIAANGIDDAARTARFQALLARDFDVPLIARFTLGRYWRGATADQRDAFVAAFSETVARTYASRLASLDLGGFEVTGAEPSGKHDMLVSSRVTRPGKEAARLAWRVRAREGRYRVIDVVFEGISMALTKREEYAAVNQANGGRIDPLIEKLVVSHSVV